MNWPYIGVGFLAASDALIGIYVFFKNPSRALHRVFALFVLGIALLAGGMALLFATHRFEFNGAVFAGGYIMTLGFVLLALKFPDNTPLPRNVWLWFLPLAALAAATPFGFVIRGMIELPDGGLEPVNGPGMPVFAAVIGAYLAFGAWKLLQKYRTLSGRARLQMQYLGLGAGAFVLATFIFNVLLPAAGVFRFNLLGPTSSLIFVAAIAYAIAKHHLLDIRVALQRGLVYFVLAGLVIGFYLALVFAASALFYRTLDESAAVLLAGAITVGAGLFAVPFIEQYFRRLTDRFFFKDRYDYPQALQRLSAILSHNVETVKISARSAHALQSIFKTGMARVILFDEKLSAVPAWHADVRALVQSRKKTTLTTQYAEEGGESPAETLPAALAERLHRLHRVEAVTPILLGRKAIGVAVLGPKRSGDPYREEDLNLLETFSHQAAVALEKARLFGQVSRHSAELEQRVRERTAELARLQEEQREMMIDISHRLQTPLAAVKAELEFLKRGRSSPKHIEAFERSINGISKFIYDLLSLARLGVGGGKIPKEKLDLSQLLRELIEYFGVMAEDQGIELVADIEPNILLTGSREYLEELVTNLVSNAFKYLEPERQSRVAIALAREKGCAVFAIADTGRGIAKEDLERIFERFYRGAQAGIAITSGTGLGLAIAKRIAENHGGKITIESEVGKGTKAVVRLPL